MTLTEAREQNGRSLGEQSSGTRVDWVTSAKPRSSLCCLPHQKRTSTSTSTSTTETSKSIFENLQSSFSLAYVCEIQDFPGIETYRESPELLSLSPALFLKRRFSEGGGGGGRQTSFCPNSDYIAMSKPLFGPKQPNGLICRPGPPSHTKTFVCLYHPTKTTSLQGVLLW